MGVHMFGASLWIAPKGNQKEITHFGATLEQSPTVRFPGPLMIDELECMSNVGTEAKNQGCHKGETKSKEPPNSS